eukprot:14822-Heterococcus_DN1.PRE.5
MDQISRICSRSLSTFSIMISSLTAASARLLSSRVDLAATGSRILVLSAGSMSALPRSLLALLMVLRHEGTGWPAHTLAYKQNDMVNGESQCDAAGAQLTQKLS